MDLLIAVAVSLLTLILSLIFKLYIVSIIALIGFIVSLFLLIIVIKHYENNEE